MSMEEKNSSAEGTEKKRPPRPKNIADRVRDLLFDTVLEQECYLWDVEYVKEGADMILRVVIDSNEGITLDDCERVSRAIDPILDEHDPIEVGYLLEVSSPGIERELTRDDHFALCVGEKVEVRLFAPVDGSRTWVGILGAMDEEGNVPVETAGTVRAFPRTAIAKIRTVFEF